MVTRNQLTSKKKRRKKIYCNRKHAIRACPQKKSICIRPFFMTPRKPNSAIRKVARVLLSSMKKVTIYLCGIAKTSPKKVIRHAKILVHGGGAKDLPGVQYSGIRRQEGRTSDFPPLVGRKNGRSKYGIKRQ